MESFKLKVEQRMTLYYNQYKYKCGISVDNAQGYPAPWRNSTKLDRELLTRIRDFTEKHNEGNKFRQSYGSISLYTNDLNTVTKFHRLSPKKASAVHEVELGPDGVKVFSKQPPANYRIYLKDKKVEYSVVDDFKEFLDRNPNIKPNRPLRRFVYSRNSYRFKHTWIYSGYFFDYDDPNVLTYVSLLFPGMVGKTYKLEKKQD